MSAPLTDIINKTTSHANYYAVFDEEFWIFILADLFEIKAIRECHLTCLRYVLYKIMSSLGIAANCYTLLQLHQEVDSELQRDRQDSSRKGVQ